MLRVQTAPVVDTAPLRNLTHTQIDAACGLDAPGDDARAYVDDVRAAVLEATHDPRIRAEHPDHLALVDELTFGWLPDSPAGRMRVLSHVRSAWAAPVSAATLDACVEQALYVAFGNAVRRLLAHACAIEPGTCWAELSGVTTVGGATVTVHDASSSTYTGSSDDAFPALGYRVVGTYYHLPNRLWVRVEER